MTFLVHMNLFCYSHIHIQVYPSNFISYLPTGSLRIILKFSLGLGLPLVLFIIPICVGLYYFFALVIFRLCRTHTNPPAEVCTWILCFVVLCSFLYMLLTSCSRFLQMICTLLTLPLLIPLCLQRHILNKRNFLPRTLRMQCDIDNFACTLQQLALLAHKVILSVQGMQISIGIFSTLCIIPSSLNTEIL